MRRWIAVFLGAMATTAAVPALASADAGTITITSNTYSGTPGFAYLGVKVTVTKATCDWPSSYCGWFPFVTEVETSQACTPERVRYTGGIVDGLGTYTQDLGSTLFDGATKRLCLYVSSYGDRLVSQLDVTLNSQPPAEPPPAEPPSGDTSAPPPPLKVREARAMLPRILRREYGRRFKRRKHFRSSCYRYSAHKVRCTVRWDSKAFRYRGAVSLRRDPDDADSVIYWTNIRRKRLRPKQTPTPPPQRNCDPNYSGCLNPNASDYDCIGGSGNGPYYTGPVRVIGNDHYDLDRDGNGIGCEDD